MPLVPTRTQFLAIKASTRPPRDKFIRVKPFNIGSTEDLKGYKDCRPVLLFEYQFSGDMTPKTFYVRPGTDVAILLADRGRLKNAVLVLGQVRFGDPFVWELKLPNGQNEIADKWAASRLEIAKVAQSKWLKPVANTTGGGYDYDEPIAKYEDPDWSIISFDEAVKAACNERVVDCQDHPAVQEALGL